MKIQSDLLTEFWGEPVDIGATLLLPAGNDDHPDVQYPAIYVQGHFSLAAPFGFFTSPVVETERAREQRLLRGVETGYELFQSWTAHDFPRLVAVTFQHPTPYFDDSYAVNSANNGPYADALMTELIPSLEEQFRFIPGGYARLLTGGSTGGYEALALQVNYPRDFAGAWIFYPDPVDFRRLFTINIYEDHNTFYAGRQPLARSATMAIPVRCGTRKRERSTRKLPLTGASITTSAIAEARVAGDRPRSGRQDPRLLRRHGSLLFQSVRDPAKRAAQYALSRPGSKGALPYATSSGFGRRARPPFVALLGCPPCAA